MDDLTRLSYSVGEIGMRWLDCVIDVSHYNGQIDWDRVDPSIALVFVKATQGAGYRDPMFRDNRARIVRSGRLVIPYHFLTIDSPHDQMTNFEWWLIEGRPFALDWEGRPGHTADAEDVEYIGEQIAADLRIETPIGYWGIPGSAPGEPTASMKAWVRWVPRYPFPNAPNFGAIPDGWRGLVDAPLWQYTAEGRVAGIDGDVGRSVWNGSLDELKAWYAAFATRRQVE